MSSLTRMARVIGELLSVRPFLARFNQLLQCPLPSPIDDLNLEVKMPLKVNERERDAKRGRGHLDRNFRSQNLATARNMKIVCAARASAAAASESLPTAATSHLLSSLARQQQQQQSACLESGRHCEAMHTTIPGGGGGGVWPSVSARRTLLEWHVLSQ